MTLEVWGREPQIRRPRRDETPPAPGIFDDALGHPRVWEVSGIEASIGHSGEAELGSERRMGGEKEAMRRRRAAASECRASAPSVPHAREARRAPLADRE